MRIIAGKFRGRHLASFKADHIRPTTNRVKESIFNKLQGYFEGAHVLDLFSGTGNLTCEAISRGAAAVDAVELSKKSIAIIRENLDMLEIGPEVRVFADDVLNYLGNYHGAPYDVILADPPFTEKLADQVLEALATSAAVGLDSVIVIEASSHEVVKAVYPRLELRDRRDYGDKQISFWRRAAESDTETTR
jgi:16S rRNA (guanine966-N2)-methyltransferase